MKKSVLLLALLWGGCSDDKVWITTSRDSLPLVQRVVGSVVEESTSGDAVALAVPRSALAAISQAQHQEHNRCGGFMLHDSEAQAREAAAQLPLIVAPQYTLDNEETVKLLLPAANEPNVLATIRKLSSFRTRFHGNPIGEQAALSIRDSWKALGKDRTDITVELVEHERTPQPSVKMTIRGTRLPDELVILGGHLDSIVHPGNTNSVAPGADDNASGIATLTEIARAAIELDYHPERTVVFYGYAAEEIGLVGSDEIAASAKADKLDVMGVMQVDMTNYTAARMPYIALVRDFTSPALTTFSKELIDTYLDLPYKVFDCGYACSDHASWTKYGFASVYPHEAASGESNKRIHTLDDTLDQSRNSATHSMHFVRFGLAFMAELAKGTLKKDEPGDAGVTRDAAVDAALDAPPTYDAGITTRDAGVLDSGGPTTAPEGEQEDAGEPAIEEEPEPGAEPVVRDGGCNVATPPLGWALALLALLTRRRRS